MKQEYEFKPWKPTIWDRICWISIPLMLLSMPWIMVYKYYHQ